MKNYLKQTDPTNIPTGSTKLIEEHFGNASLKYEQCSIARMEAPPGWKEPFQNPEFDEFTLVAKGQMLVKIDGQKEVVKAGQTILVKRGARVQYSNPFDRHSEYWSVCLPPFSLATVHREK
ncbi:MAG: cupin domain-containing protein [Cyclobacteriaceae bacterium]